MSAEAGGPIRPGWGGGARHAPRVWRRACGTLRKRWLIRTGPEGHKPHNLTTCLPIFFT